MVVIFFLFLGWQRGRTVRPGGDDAQRDLEIRARVLEHIEGDHRGSAIITVAWPGRSSRSRRSAVCLPPYPPPTIRIRGRPFMISSNSHSLKPNLIENISPGPTTHQPQRATPTGRTCVGRA
jgi:hypothetical protein